METAVIRLLPVQFALILTTSLAAEVRPLEGILNDLNATVWFVCPTNADDVAWLSGSWKCVERLLRGPSSYDDRYTYLDQLEFDPATSSLRGLPAGGYALYPECYYVSAPGRENIVPNPVRVRADFGAEGFALGGPSADHMWLGKNDTHVPGWMVLKHQLTRDILVFQRSTNRDPSTALLAPELESLNRLRKPKGPVPAVGGPLQALSGESPVLGLLSSGKPTVSPHGTYISAAVWFDLRRPLYDHLAVSGHETATGVLLWSRVLRYTITPRDRSCPPVTASWSNCFAKTFTIDANGSLGGRDVWPVAAAGQGIPSQIDRYGSQQRLGLEIIGTTTDDLYWAGSGSDSNRVAALLTRGSSGEVHARVEWMVLPAAVTFKRACGPIGLWGFDASYAIQAHSRPTATAQTPVASGTFTVEAAWLQEHSEDRMSASMRAHSSWPIEASGPALLGTAVSGTQCEWEVE